MSEKLCYITKWAMFYFKKFCLKYSRGFSGSEILWGIYWVISLENFQLILIEIPLVVSPEVPPGIHSHLGIVWKLFRTDSSRNVSDDAPGISAKTRQFFQEFYQRFDKPLFYFFLFRQDLHQRFFHTVILVNYSLQNMS